MAVHLAFSRCWWSCSTRKVGGSGWWAVGESCLPGWLDMKLIAHPHVHIRVSVCVCGCAVCMCPCLSKLIEFCTQVAKARVASATSRCWGVALAPATGAVGAIFKHWQDISEVLSALAVRLRKQQQLFCICGCKPRKVGHLVGRWPKEGRLLLKPLLGEYYILKIWTALIIHLLIKHLFEIAEGTFLPYWLTNVTKILWASYHMEVNIFQSPFWGTFYLKKISNRYFPVLERCLFAH